MSQLQGPSYWGTGGSGVNSSSANSLSPTNPSVAAGAGGILLAVVTSYNNDAHSCATAGWSLISQVNSGASFTASIWKADQGAAAPTFTWATAAASHASIHYYAGANDDTDINLGGTATNFGTSATHSTGAIVTSRNYSLIVTVDCIAQNNTWPAPSGWANDINVGNATSTTRVCLFSKFVSSSGTSSGGFSSTNSVSGTYVQFQIEVKSATATELDAVKLEVSPWIDPSLNGLTPNGALASLKLELSPWGEPQLLSVAACKLEFGVWLEPPPAITFKPQIIRHH